MNEPTHVLVDEADYSGIQPWDDFDAAYYGCGVDGCCVDEEWWAPVMPSRAFLREGLVHMSVDRATHAFCGMPAVPYGLTLHSTDAVREYAALVSIAGEEVTCMQCIALQERDDFPY